MHIVVANQIGSTPVRTVILMYERRRNVLHHKVTIGYVGWVVHLYEERYAIPSDVCSELTLKKTSREDWTLKGNNTYWPLTKLKEFRSMLVPKSELQVMPESLQRLLGVGM